MICVGSVEGAEESETLLNSYRDNSWRELIQSSEELSKKEFQFHLCVPLCNRRTNQFCRGIEDDVEGCVVCVS